MIMLLEYAQEIIVSIIWMTKRENGGPINLDKCISKSIQRSFIYTLVSNAHLTFEWLGKRIQSQEYWELITNMAW